MPAGCAPGWGLLTSIYAAQREGEQPEPAEREFHAWVKQRAWELVPSRAKDGAARPQSRQRMEQCHSLCACACAEEGFQLPAVAKPVAANGTNSSHLLSLVLEPQALAHLETPVILQVCPASA